MECNEAMWPLSPCDTCDILWHLAAYSVLTKQEAGYGEHQGAKIGLDNINSTVGGKQREHPWHAAPKAGSLSMVFTYAYNAYCLLPESARCLCNPQPKMRA